MGKRRGAVAGRTGLTEDGRRVLVAGAVGAGITLLATAVAGLLIGVVAATGAPGALRVAAAVLTAAPAGMGALVAARRATDVLDHGPQAAAVGVAGALVVVVLIAALSLLADDTSVAYAVVFPVLGALAGGAIGGGRPRRGQ